MTSADIAVTVVVTAMGLLFPFGVLYGGRSMEALHRMTIERLNAWMHEHDCRLLSCHVQSIRPTRCVLRCHFLMPDQTKVTALAICRKPLLLGDVPGIVISPVSRATPRRVVSPRP